ncbi:enoyl-CoA hydratase/isomerase family protein [Lutimaribacter saemankumensis]|uniref:3-hydroxyisobutyryl-CoA hydrolase n=1 Tax=Lutimaribacter saemankumensis TaxID=490829 RepID=A0A1G8GRQ9_9RHOB|nr:enoyl-CoA hydratase/isomerase family protein [Lutimaribacter saemankumensis]SDH97049.1 Enoyl-CoA hydratase/carnithine racemase [Lutimaribacter saemankumensis]
MADIDIRIEGCAGRITLNRPKALNALTYDMAMGIHAALRDWAGGDAVRLIVIDAAGDKAFCAGGDIADLYRTGTEGDFAYGRKFWADEYRMNAALFEFPKPVVSLMQGFTMGGGVGVGCHGSHRIVGDSSRIAMPECGIGLVPDVGGSMILARAPGRLGEYLGTSAARLGAADAILAGFADTYVPEGDWPALIAELCRTGDVAAVARAARSAPDGALVPQMAEIDRHFAGASLNDVLASLRREESAFTAATLKSLSRNSPLSMACTVAMVQRLRGTDGIRPALDMEYRYTWRAMEQADFLEGIRAAIIDKDRNPRWRHDLDGVTPADVDAMLAPLGADALTFEEEE